MGTSQQFSLRWNNYLRHIRGAFDSFRSDEDLVDVTLSCEGRKIRAHKMLLSACSTYFRDLFKENPCQHPVIIFKDVKFVDLKALIDFIYQGEVNVVQDQLSSFLLTAELLAVQGLTDGSSKDASQSPPSANETKLLDLSPRNENRTTESSESAPGGDVCPDSPPVKKQRSNDTSCSSVAGDCKVDNQGASVSACATDKLSETSATSGLNSHVEVFKKTKVEDIRPADMIKVEMPEYLDNDSVDLCASSENSEEHIESFSSASRTKEPIYFPNLNSQEVNHHNPLLDISRVMGLCGPSSGLCSREHTQEYVCSECSAAFSSVQGLQVHKNRHNGGTACELCLKDFGSRSNLRKHFFEVHSWCLLCSVNFSTKACLRKHIDKEHGNVQQYLKSFNQNNFLWH